MPKTQVKIPIVAHIYWKETDKKNPDSPEAKKLREYADDLYDFLNRKTEDPLDRYLEIPVFLHPMPPDRVEGLRLDQCKYSLHIILIDDDLVVNGAKNWSPYLRQLAVEVRQLGRKHQIVPVALTKNFDQLPLLTKLRHAVLLYKEREQRQNRLLLASIANSLARMLYDRPIGAKKTPLPVKVFISHTKIDLPLDDEAEMPQKDPDHAKKKKLSLPKALHEHLNSNFSIDTFFDEVRMMHGYSFEEQIEEEIQDSVLLVVHTDNYSTREWCRKEVLLAKRYNRPILVVNQFEFGELRSFPYLGNVPYLHFTQEQIGAEKEQVFLLDYILIATLRETLRFKYNELRINALADTFGLEERYVISYPPELVTLRTRIKEGEPHIVLYPDPPLGPEELELLKEFQPESTFLTPALLALTSEEGENLQHLDHLKVGISLSGQLNSPVADIENRGIQDLMVNITKYLLVSGATLVYAGDLNYKNTNTSEKDFNYTRLLIDLITIYHRHFNQDGRIAIESLRAYSFFPISEFINEDTQAHFQSSVEFMPAKKPNIPGLSLAGMKNPLSPEDFYDKMVWAESLYLMRREMEKDEDVRIFLGGKWIEFKGRMPGVLEEFLIAMEQQQPLFLLGGYGGVSRGIAEALTGESPPQFSLDFYEYNYPSYPPFLQEYNSECPERAVNFPKILNLVHQYGKGQADFGLNNGLNREENLTLFQSRFDIEIISLLLKGLKNIKAKSAK